LESIVDWSGGGTTPAELAKCEREVRSFLSRDPAGAKRGKRQGKIELYLSALRARPQESVHPERKSMEYKKTTSIKIIITDQHIHNLLNISID
jgi:hypothetical protein